MALNEGDPPAAHQPGSTVTLSQLFTVTVTSSLISDQDLSDHCSLYHCDRVVSLVTGWSVEWLHPHVKMCECDVIQRGRFLWVTPLPWIMAGCATTGDGIGTAFQ